jgi:hypothetical protein
MSLITEPAASLAPTLTDPPARLSGVVLARVGGVTTATCDLVSPATAAALDELAELDARSGPAREAVGAALYALVPLLDDHPALRRRVLAGRRRAHQGSDLGWDPDAAAAIRKWLDVGSRAAVDAWETLARRSAQLEADLAELVAADDDRAERLLRQAAGSPRLAASLALTSPEWARHGLQQLRQGRRLDPRGRRTLYSYVVRAAVKTSPLGRLTAVTAPGAPRTADHCTYLSVEVATACLEAVARDRRTAAALRWRPAPSRPGTPGQTMVLLQELSAGRGTSWRREEVVVTEDAELPDLPVGRDLTLQAVLEAIGGRDPWSRLLRLLDAGLLHPVPPWERGQDALRALHSVLPEGEDRTAAAELLRAVDALPGPAPADLDPTAAGGTDDVVAHRLRLVDSVTAQVARWHTRSRLPLPVPAQPVFEDASTDATVPAHLLRAVEPDLHQLAARVRPHVFRSHHYDVLRDALVARHGHGGMCEDVLALLLDCSTDPAVQRATAQARRDDAQGRGHPSSRAGLAVSASSAPPTTAVMLQVEPGEPGDVIGDKHCTVVSQFNPGTGGLLSRFGPLVGGAEPWLGPWTRSLFPGVRVCELVCWSDTSPAQARSGGVHPPLVWPGEPGAPGAVGLEDVVLRHVAADDTLLLTTRGGEVVGLPYLGIVPPHLLTGVQRLLAVLADPWVNGSPDADYVPPIPGALPTADGVVHLPRRVDGRLVLRRESWVVPTAVLPLAPGGRPGAPGVRQVDRWRRALGIPAEVFVTAVPSDHSPEVDRKPLWYDLRSATSLDALTRWVAALPGGGHLRFSEVLPRRHLHPARGADGVRALELVTLLAWPRPREDR